MIRDQHTQQYARCQPALPRMVSLLDQDKHQYPAVRLL